MGQLVKIIATDNYDRDYVDDHVVAERVPVGYAEIIVKHLNVDDDQSWFYKAVPEDYKLKKFEP